MRAGKILDRARCQHLESPVALEAVLQNGGLCTFSAVGYLDVMLGAVRFSKAS